MPPCGCWHPPFRAELHHRCWLWRSGKEGSGIQLVPPLSVLPQTRTWGHCSLLSCGLATCPTSLVPRGFAEGLHPNPHVAFSAWSSSFSRMKSLSGLFVQILATVWSHVSAKGLSPCFIICIMVTVSCQGSGYSRNTEQEGWSLPRSSILWYLAGQVWCLPCS